jgi:hypothetical protein
MKPEEIAVLRILYKYKTPQKLSTLVGGFPDESSYLIKDAISTLQSLSLISLIDCTSELYVTLNRDMKKVVLKLIEGDHQKYGSRKLLDNRAEQESMSSEGFSIQDSFRPKSGLIKRDDRELLLRIPRRAVKTSATLLLLSIVFLGTIAILNSQTTATGNGSFYDGINDAQVVLSSLPGTSTREGNFNAATHVYTVVSNSDAPSYYIIPAEQTILVLRQVSQIPSNSNFSFSVFPNDLEKVIAST